jgi:hypothetical protein
MNVQKGENISFQVLQNCRESEKDMLYAPTVNFFKSKVQTPRFFPQWRPKYRISSWWWWVGELG